MKLKDKAVQDLSKALGCSKEHAEKHIEAMICEVKGNGK